MRLIAFDLDDTLYKERDFVASGYRAIADRLEKKYGFRSSEMINVMSTAPLNPFDSLAEYLTNRAIQQGLTVDEDIAWMVDTYRHHIPEIKVSPDVSETLTTLKKRGNRLALITDGRVITQSNKIISLGIDEIIDEGNISISEAIGAEKYHRLPFDRIMKLNPDVDSFAYVGDNPMKDFLWPNRLGWTTIQLKDNGRNVHSQSIELPANDYRPQMVIDRLSDLLAIFP